MYKMQRGDSEDSTGSSFWSDRESKDEEEDGTRSGFKQKGTKMESIQGAMEEKKANRLRQQQDGKSSGSEERIDRWVVKEGCDSSTSREDPCKKILDEKILKKQDQNVAENSENGETSGSGEEYGELKIGGQKEEALVQEVLGEERSVIDEDSSENAETSGDEDEERIGNVRTAAKSGTSTGDSWKGGKRRKKWRDFSDDSSMNGETSSDDGYEVRPGRKSLCLETSGNSEEFREDSLESGRSSSGDSDEEEAESEPGVLEEGYKTSMTSNTDTCNGEEKIEEFRDVAGESLDIEKATESSYDSSKNAKNVQNFKKQKEETVKTRRKSEFSSENAHSSSEGIESCTDYEEEQTGNHEEFLKEGYNSSSTCSSRDEKKRRNFLENERTVVRDGTESRSDNGRNGKNPEKRDSRRSDKSLENAKSSSDVDGSSTDKMDNEFEDGEAEAKTEPRILEEGYKSTTSNTDSCKDKKKLKTFRNFTGGSSENAKTSSNSNDEAAELEDVSKPGITVRGDSFVDKKKFKKQRNFYSDSSGNEETSSSPCNSIDNGEDAAEILEKGLATSTGEESMADEKKLEKCESSLENERDKTEKLLTEDAAMASNGFLGDKLKDISTFGEEISENGSCGVANGGESAIEKEELGRGDKKSNMCGDLAAESSGNQETNSEIGLNADEEETDELDIQMQGLKSDLNTKSWTEDEKLFEDRSSENVTTSSNDRKSGDEEMDNIEREFTEEDSKYSSNRDSQNECEISGDFAEASSKKSGIRDDFVYGMDKEKDWMNTPEMDIVEECSKPATSAEDINDGLEVALEEERLEIAENSDCENIICGSYGDKCTATTRESLNLEKGDQNTRVDLAEDGAENGRSSGQEEGLNGEDGKVEITQEIQGHPRDFKRLSEEEKLDRLSNESNRNAETWEAGREDSEEIERWFEEEALAEKQDEIYQQSDTERLFGQIKVDKEGCISVSPATSLMTSGYGTYRSEKQDGHHNVDDDDRLTIAEFDKDSLYSFGVCEQDVGEIQGLGLRNKLDCEKEGFEGGMGDEDEFWDGAKSENAVECERDGRVEAELCLEKAESDEEDEESSNKDIKFIDSKVDQSGTSHKRMYEEWEGNLRPPIEGASCLEERLAGLHLSTSVQHESENEDLTSHSESPSSESLSEGAFESYVRGMSRSHSEGDIRPKPKSFIRPVLGPTGPKKTDPVAKYFQYKQLWDLFKLPGENDRKALRWEIKERLAYQPPLPKPRKVLVPNTYTVPTEKKRSALRWEIRNDLASGNLPHSYNYRF